LLCIQSYTDSGYFQEYYGYYCVDSGEVPGKAGSDIDEFIFRKLRRRISWPITDSIGDLDEDAFFDVVELIFDTISKPIDGYFHEFSGCGMHYSTFNNLAGRNEFRHEINVLLCDYQDGFELGENGEIHFLLSPGLNELTKAQLPTKEEEKKTIKVKVDRAVQKYRDRHSTIEDRKEAVRELADVLEFLRPQIKSIMGKKDDNELFNIANNFMIRHNNHNQKSDYSIEWLSWIFYLYLSTIHLILRLREKK
jgi:hypothetical protein